MCISNDLQNTKDMQGLKKCISPKYCTVNTIDFQSHSAKKKKKKWKERAGTALLGLWCYKIQQSEKAAISVNRT